MAGIRSMFRLEWTRPQPPRKAEENFNLTSSSIGRGTPAKSQPAAGAVASPALAWLWNYLSDVARPHILDCGSFRASTAEILLRRGAKLYVADLIAPLLQNDALLWDRSRKTHVFKTEAFLAQLPKIPPASLSLVLCWQLLDLLPHDSLAAFILQMQVYLRTGGVFFCFLREPYLTKGVEPGWRLGTLMTLKKDNEGTSPFPYPAITSREVERLLPTGNVKTFLTRAGFREVVALR